LFSINANQKVVNRRNGNRRSTTLIAPAGNTRVVGIDLFGDYDDQSIAFKVADEHNESRTGPMDDVYYVYDDQGNYVRGNEAVDYEVSP